MKRYLLFLILFISVSSIAQIKILRIGDSNTRGYSGGGYFLSLIQNANLTFTAQGTQMSWGHQGDHNYSEGYSGQKIEFFAQYQSSTGDIPIERMFNDYNPDYVFLMIGTNNMSGSSPNNIPDLTNKYEVLLTEIESRIPAHTKVIIATIPWATDPVRDAKGVEFNEQVVVPLVNQHIQNGAPFYLVDAHVLINSESEMIDGVHPNSAGMKKINDMWFNKMMELENGGGNTDCHGVSNGNASIDNCNVCSGGTTGIIPNSTCAQDCNGDWGGSAVIDQCNTCAGGNTSNEPNACLDCDPTSASTHDGNLPENTLDNDINTRWSAQGDGEYIEYCLSDTLDVNAVEFAFYRGDVRTSTFDVLSSLDGVSWETVLTQQTSSGSTLQKETFPFPTKAMYKIRFVGHGNSDNDWNSLTEASWQTSPILSTTTEDSFKEINFYPNPCNGSVSFSKKCNYNLFDSMGRLLLSGEGTYIDLSQYSPGLYQIAISQGTSQPLVIQN